MSSSKVADRHTKLAAQAADLQALVEPLLADGTADQVPDEAVQQLMTAAVKLYVAKREAEIDLDPFVDNRVTATEVAVVTTGMLKAVNLELFELSLWGGWGRIESGRRE